ncbi:MAG: BlaI/MecI/CopY family transcriptional regulator [Leadbetterella sp.]|nr:BlaI/MecI/CopY family transcriptional regulator [Leadbetterella sp.]
MEKLTAQEEEAMRAIWKLEGGFVKDILDEMTSDMPYTTLASTIKNLEKKGYVSHERHANANKYIPRISQTDYKRSFMSGFVGEYFGNSYKEMVSFFAEEQKLKPEELEEILKIINKK